VRRVDDALLGPRRERVRARRAERHAHAVGEREHVAPAVAEQRGGLGEGLAAAGLDLDLRRDELARGVGAERRRVGQSLQLLEAVDHAERLRVEDLELLLDPDREIGRLGEQAAGLVEGLDGVGNGSAHADRGGR
jgi:hypothetical protein